MAAAAAGKEVVMAHDDQEHGWRSGGVRRSWGHAEKVGMDAEAAKVAVVQASEARPLKMGRIRTSLKESAAERSRVRGSLA